MKDIKKLLVLIEDGSDLDALAGQVVALGHLKTPAVELLCVVDLSIHSEDRDIIDVLTEQHQGMLDAAKRQFSSAGVRTTSSLRYGRSYNEIMTHVDEYKPDIVIKTADPDHGLRQRLFGSHDMQLLRHCPVPMLIQKPAGHTDIRRLVIALDLVELDSSKMALAAELLRWGQTVARATEAEINVVHVWNLYHEDTLRGHSVSAETVDRLVVQEEKKHWNLLQKTVADSTLDQETTRVHFHKGLPKQMIPALAESLKCDLLVMGTVGRSGIPGMFIGNTAESVLHHVDCAVLAIKPGSD